MEDSDSDSRYIKCCGINCCRKKSETSETANVTCAAFDCAAETNAVFCGDLPQPLLPGHCIQVTGKPLETCERFTINFTSGISELSDIVFHFNPRLNENYVVRNSRLNGKWGTEETTSHKKLYLPRKTTFCISFFIAPKEFMVAINGHHFCNFTFRIPIARAAFIDVQGEVTVTDVDVKELSSYPEPENLGTELKRLPFKDIYDGKTALHKNAQYLEGRMENRENVFPQPNPYIGHLNRKFQNGWQLEIYGKVKLLPRSFYINLQEGKFLWPHPIIPLHLNPRFNTPNYGNVLIRNSWYNGSWGSEERSPGFYFLPSKSFRLIIQLDLQRELFIVWVNGQLQGEFRIRNLFSSRNIDTVHIQGDLIIYKVFIQEKFSKVLENVDEEI